MNTPQPVELPTIRRVTHISNDLLSGLSDVLLDCVRGGASVGFVEPFTPAKALAFWERVAGGASSGSRVLLIAEDASGICGTVQLDLGLPPNQAHRADLCKMLVHSRARRRGLGERLMRAAEAAALEHGRWLLVLDAVTGGDASRLYERLGWTRVGDVPDFAVYPDGRLCGTTYYYKRLTAEPGREAPSGKPALTR
jgi:GNAT superfamily N-acetyltransferase